MRKTLGLALAAAAVAILAACGGGDDTASSPTPAGTATPTPTPAADGTATPTPLATSTPTPTAAPTASPTTAAEGGPYSLADLEREWEAKGITVTLGDPSTGLGGFGGTATDVRLTKGGDTMDLSILAYGSSEAVSEDWELVPGEAPTAKPKPGRNLLEHVSTWWNENVVVMVISGSGDIGADALAGFLDLGS